MNSRRAPAKAKRPKADYSALLLPALAAAGLPAPEAEVVFHPTRKWRFDFAWRDEKIALEVDGGAWIGGRHTSGSGFLGDMEKFREAAILGWRVVRVTPQEVRKGLAVGLMRRIFQKEVASEPVA